MSHELPTAEEMIRDIASQICEWLSPRLQAFDGEAAQLFVAFDDVSPVPIEFAVVSATGDAPYLVRDLAPLDELGLTDADWDALEQHSAQRSVSLGSVVAEATALALRNARDDLPITGPDLRVAAVNREMRDYR